MQIDTRINHARGIQSSAPALRQPLTPQAPSLVLHFQGKSHSNEKSPNWFQRYFIQPIQTLWTKIKTFFKNLWPGKSQLQAKTTPKPAPTPDKPAESNTPVQPAEKEKVSISTTPARNYFATLPRVNTTPTTTTPQATASKPKSDDSAPQTPPLEEANNQRPHLQTTGTPLNMDALFVGSNLQNIRIQQKDGNTCYLLSALDAIFHHPQGKRLLEKIKFQEYDRSYLVQFPGQSQAIEVLKSELRYLKLANGNTVRGVQTNSLGVQLIEAAFSKLPAHPVEPEEHFGEPTSSTLALEKIFGRKENRTGRIILHNDQNIRQFIGGAEFPFEERKAQLQAYLRSIQTAPTAARDLDIFTAIPYEGLEHYVSIRLDQSTPENIVIADPLDTQQRVQSIPIDTFLNEYNIEGLRVYQ